jgi:peptide/nickel transport system substrate-binding protein
MMQSPLRLQTLCVVVGLLMAALLAGCGNNGDAGKAASGPSQQILRAVMFGELRSPDPLSEKSAIGRTHGFMVYDTLFGVDSAQVAQPQMVESWTISDDGLAYSFTLRSGLKFHDGAAVQASDCVASIQRWTKYEKTGERLRRVLKELVAKDERTFTLTLIEPYGYLLDGFAKGGIMPAFIMPERYARLAPNDRSFVAIGSGPFVFKADEWRPGSRVVYEKNAQYLPRAEPADFLSGGKGVHFDRVEFIALPDHNSAASALVAGEIDYFENPTPDSLPHLSGHDEVTVAVLDPLGSQGVLRINHLNPPFNDVRARRALLYAVDRDQFMQSVTSDPSQYVACGAYFMCGGPLESSVGEVGRDVEKAKQLLKESGYRGEKVVVLQPTNNPQLNALTVVAVSQLRHIGLNIDAQPMDYSTALARRMSKAPLSQGGWNLYLTSLQGLDASAPLNPFLAANCDDNEGSWACDQQIEDLRSDLLRQSDPAPRKVIAAKLQQRTYDVVQYVALGQYVRLVAYRADLVGVVTGAPVFWNMQRRSEGSANE